jgi:hypothetical protein
MYLCNYVVVNNDNTYMYMDITWLVINDSRISVSIPLAKVGDILQ